MKSRFFAGILCLIMLFGLVACKPEEPVPFTVLKDPEDVVVLFTNDVHCGIDGNIGYAGLSAYKKSMSEKYAHVLLVDCGDFTSGEYEGTVSKGEYLVDIANSVGYDYMIFGNHEFDYGMEQLKKLVAASNAQFLNCNVTYTGNGEDWMKTSTKPYEIKTCGEMKIGFIGVTTPNTILSTTPAIFMEDGKNVYDFAGGEDGQKLYTTVQKYVDECRAQGAKYVVVLSHLGTDDEDSPYTSLDLISNTNGIDAVLDAHSHTEASCWIRQNKDGRDVLLSSTGSKLNKIGQLILGGDGIATVGTVDVYDRKDDGITDKIVSIRSEFESKMETKVGHIDFALPIKDEDGIRMIRTREMPIGDFVADAYRIIGNADIGMCNGGGIAAGLEAGDVTYRDIIAVAPRGNSLCVVKVTGAEIVDMLEYFYRKTQAEYAADGKAVGEEGSFQQVSGLRFTVNTSVATSIQVDDDDAMTGVGDTRRVSDVMVLKDGEYVPIDLSATYTLASHNYMIKNGGSGMLHHLAGHELVVDESIADYQVLIDYMNMLGDDIAKYKTVDDRITVK